MQPSVVPAADSLPPPSTTALGLTWDPTLPCQRCCLMPLKQTFKFPKWSCISFTLQEFQNGCGYRSMCVCVCVCVCMRMLGGGGGGFLLPLFVTRPLKLSLDSANILWFCWVVFLVDSENTFRFPEAHLGPQGTNVWQRVSAQGPIPRHRIADNEPNLHVDRLPRRPSPHSHTCPDASQLQWWA